MKVYRLEEFKCIECKQIFNPPTLMPHVMPCSHPLCSRCLRQHVSQRQSQIICPEDHEINPIKDINLNKQTETAIIRIMKQQKIVHESTHLSSIQSLCGSLEKALDSCSLKVKKVTHTLEQAFKQEINRLTQLHQRIMEELENPSNQVQTWKERVSHYCRKIQYSNQQHPLQFPFFIQEGRKIKSQVISRFRWINFEKLSMGIVNGQCFQDEFSIYQYLEEKSTKIKDNRKQMQIHISKENQFNQEKHLKSIFNHKNSKQNCKNVHKKNIQKKSEEVEEKTLRGSPFKKQTSNYFYQEPSFTSFQNKHISTQKTINWNRNDQKSIDSSPLEQLINFNNSSEIEENHKDRQELLMYSPEPQDIDYPQQQLLLSERDNCVFVPTKINFLKEYPMHKQRQIQQMEVQKKDYIEVEETCKVNYMRKQEGVRVEEAVQKTTIRSDFIELIGVNIDGMDLKAYLQNFDWSTIKIVKMVKVGLNDQQLNSILNFTLKSKVDSLVLPGNQLSELSLDALINYTNLNHTLRKIYLSKNNISSLKGNSRAKLQLLKEKGLSIYL